MGILCCAFFLSLAPSLLSLTHLQTLLAAHSLSSDHHFKANLLKASAVIIENKQALAARLNPSCTEKRRQLGTPVYSCTVLTAALIAIYRYNELHTFNSLRLDLKAFFLNFFSFTDQ